MLPPAYAEQRICEDCEGGNGARDNDSTVPEDIACAICDSADEVDMLLCDRCAGGFHTRCVGLTAVPEGDWFCTECSSIRLAEIWLRRRRLYRREAWLTAATLPFAIGDFVVILYPAKTRATIYLVRAIEVSVGDTAAPATLSVCSSYNTGLPTNHRYPHLTRARSFAPFPILGSTFGKRSSSFGHLCTGLMRHTCIWQRRLKQRHAESHPCTCCHMHLAD